MKTLPDLIRNTHPEELASRWHELPVNAAALIEAVVSILAVPRALQTTSFQLHAPLELLARAALLPWADDESRQGALLRIAEIGSRYHHSGPAFEAESRSFVSLSEARSVLTASFTEADADNADAALTFLLRNEPIRQTLARLRPYLVSSLGAAAHAPILVNDLVRVSGRIANAGQLLRAPLRSLWHHPAELHWHREPDALISNALSTREASALLYERLAAPDFVTIQSHSIAPTMFAVESGAKRLLAEPCSALDSWSTEIVLSRIAARAMIEEPLTHAPYGWTHALTLPQAMLRMTIDTPQAQEGVAVATTYALGFRATLGSKALSAEEPLETCSPEQKTVRKCNLANTALVHPDAHFVKYVLACFDAAESDPEATHLYLSAAERLAVYWKLQSE